MKFVLTYILEILNTAGKLKKKKKKKRVQHTFKKNESAVKASATIDLV